MCDTSRVGIFRRISDALTLTSAPAPTFSTSIDSDSIDPAVFGLTSYSSPLAKAPRIDRATAMQVPAVKRARDLIACAAGALPIQTLNQQRADVTGGLLQQPEVGVPRVITMTRLVEDLLFEGIAWWLVKSLRADGFPDKVRRLDPRQVTVDEKGEVRWSGLPDRPLRDDEVIRFDGPTDGILIAGGRAIRTCLMLDSRAFAAAENPEANGYFTPDGGVDPFDEDDPDNPDDPALYTPKRFLTEWQEQRQQSTQAYVPGGLKYVPLSWSPRDLQLTDARQTAILELARLTGLDPEDLGVSTTSRTYFNAETKRRDRIDFTLGPYLWAIQERLSMGDVTPRGQYVRFKLDAFLRTDTAARYSTYQQALDMDLLSLPEIRELEDLPPRTATPTPQQETAVNDNVRQLPQASSSAGSARFAGEAADLCMSSPAAVQFKVDLESRTITGLALPYGQVAISGGARYQFEKGSLVLPEDPSRVKLFVNHDPNQAVGYATKLEDTDAGLIASFKVAPSPAGDHALLMADAKVWDGLSAGLKAGGKFTEKDGVRFAQSAPVGEISVCPVPAFDDARVSAVALSADYEGNDMKCTKCGQIHAAGVSTCDPDALAAFAASAGPQFGQGPVTIEVKDAPGFGQAIADGISAAFEKMGKDGTFPGVGGRELVPAGGEAARFAVTEELPYRFDGSTAGEHCFTDDLRDAQNGNQEAKQRLEKFMEQQHEFAVTSSNVASMNPTQNRPELYVPRLQFARPLWDSVSTGVITDKTPFTVPKFGTLANLAGDHTEGVEPTPGSFTATVQTVQPTAISGKVEINREVWDQGGNPQTDTIIWNEMQNAYYEAIEAKIAALLNAIPAANLYSGAEINLGGAVDAALNTALTNLLVDLQFVRGGNRYNRWVADSTLYKALAGAKDSAGRPLFPLLNPMNANGQLDSTGSPLSAVNVAGQVIRPAWALQGGVANAQNSYGFVPTSVWAWASPPKRFTFEYQVKSIDMAVWGYTGSAVLRESDVIRIDYTTADV